MLYVEQSTFNIISNYGLFSIPIEAFQFNWDRLYTIFTSTFHKFERYCPNLKTIQTLGGNPTIMPKDCIYPRAIGFGNSLMIPPQTVAVERQSWTYDRATKQLYVFTKTGTTATFQVQYLAKYNQLEPEKVSHTYNTLISETEIEIQLDTVPDINTMMLNYSADGINDTFSLKSRNNICYTFEGENGTAELNLTELTLTVTLNNATTEGTISIEYTNKYGAYDEPMDDSLDFFEMWYAANILSSLGNIKSVLKMDQLPNDISADGLLDQGKDLMKQVEEAQKEKSFWFRGYISARV